LPPENQMRVVREQHNLTIRIGLSGRITIDDSPELRALLLRNLSSDCQILIVDFCEVVYIDTSGVAVLLELLKAARQLRKTFQLSGVRERPRYLLESTGLLRLFAEVKAPCHG